MSKEAKSHEIVCDIKRVASDIGHAPSKREYIEHGAFSERQIRNAFGNFAPAIHAAGLISEKPKAKPKIKAEDLFGRDIVDVLAEYHRQNSPQMTTRQTKIEPTLFIPDTHFPFVCQRTLSELYYFIKQHKHITTVVQLGDLFDSLSNGKFPRSMNIYTPKQEIDLGFQMAHEMWAKIRELLPEATCHQILGNHDIRPLKRILEAYPEGEMFFSIDKYFKFDGVETLMDTRQELDIDDALITHGTYTKIGDHVRFYRKSVVHGHTHRAGVHFIPYDGEILFELDCGLMGDPKSKALSYTPSKITHWSLGWGYRDEWGPRFIPAGQADDYNGAAATPDFLVD